MAETTEKDKADKGGSGGKLGLSGSGGSTLTLGGKTVEKRQTRQNFSHGRSKMVTVEVKKRRTISTGKDDARPAAPEAEVEATSTTEDGDAPLRELTEQERVARQKALETAQQAKDEPVEELPQRPLGPTIVEREVEEPEPEEESSSEEKVGGELPKKEGWFARKKREFLERQRAKQAEFQKAEERKNAKEAVMKTDYLAPSFGASSV